MAGNIKGIVVEIGGNTGPLDKALQGVNKTSRDLQSELRQVEKLLKLDPTNTELLAQKQKLLAQSIDTTSGKLKNLKDAEKQAQQQFKDGKISEEQYRALQREVIKTEQELKKIESQTKKTGDGFDYLGEKSEKFNGHMKNAGVAVGAVALALGTASAKMSIDFADSIAKVSTIADETEVPLDDLKQQILELSDQTGISATEIANNAYDAISAGQSTGDAVNFVTNSTKLAKAGFSEAGQSLDLLTTILNAYGMESENASKVSDILIQVQNKGKVTVGELSEAMGKIIPTANASNVSLEQLGAGYAIMTSKGIKAAETTTYMNSMLNELSKSGTISSDILKSATGKSFQDLMKDGKSLSDVLAILEGEAKKNGKSLSDMFGSAEAGKAALTLLGDSADVFNKSVQDMNNSVGSTDAAFEKLQTPGEELRKSFNEIKNTGIELGDALSPVVSIISDLISWIVDNKSAVVTSLAAISGGLLAFNVTAMIQGLVGAIKAFQLANQGATIAQWAMNVALSANPIGIIVMLIAGLVAAIVVLWKTNEDFRNNFTSTWNSIQESLSEIMDEIKALVSIALKKITEWWSEHGESIMKILKIVGEFIGGTIANLFKVISGWVKMVSGILSGDWGKAWEGAKQMVGGFVDQVILVFNTLIKTLYTVGKNIVEGLWQGMTNTKDWLLNKIKGFAKNITQGIKDFFGIKSPSTVMRDEVGMQIGEGIAVGIEESSETVMKSAEQLAKDSVEAAKKAFDNSLSWLDEEKYYNRLSLQQELEGWERIQARYELGTEERKKADREIYRVKNEMNSKLKGLEDDYYKKVSEVNSKLVADIKKVNDEYDNALKSRTDSLYNFSGLFDKVNNESVSGDELVQNLQDQVAEFDNWQANINELAKKGIDEGLIQELKDMGPKASGQIEALTRLSDGKLNVYVTLWKTKHSQAKEQATKELEGLKKETDLKIIELTKSSSIQLDKYKIEWDAKISEITQNTKSQFDNMVNDSLSSGMGIIANLINGLDIMKEPLNKKINEIQKMISTITSGLGSLGSSSTSSNIAIKSVVSSVAATSNNPLAKAASIVINNSGTLVGSNGMKEFANTISKELSGKYGLTVGGAF